MEGSDCDTLRTSPSRPNLQPNLPPDPKSNKSAQPYPQQAWHHPDSSLPIWTPRLLYYNTTSLRNYTARKPFYFPNLSNRSPNGHNTNGTPYGTERTSQQPSLNHPGNASAPTHMNTTRQPTQTQTTKQPATLTKPNTFCASSPTTHEPGSSTKNKSTRKP